MKKNISVFLITLLTLCFMLSVSVCAVPKPENSFISFTIYSSETYPDGSPLEEGECYAIVWSNDGKFDGFNPAGTPIDSNDKVIYIGKIFVDATIMFQLDTGDYTDGVFEIFILDSRVFKNGELVSIGKNTNGKISVSDYVKATNAEPETSQTSLPDIGVNQPNIPNSIPPLKFTSIKLDGDFVVMEADGPIPGVNYAAVGNSDETGGKLVLIRQKEGDSAIIRGIVKTMLSEGNWWIIAVIGVVAVAVALLLILKKKRSKNS